MTRAKRPIPALIIACLILAGVAGIIWIVPPTTVWMEIGTVVLFATGLGLASSWLVGRKKTAFVVVSFVMTILLMNRLEILSWITFGLLMAVLGLISLIN